MAMPPAQNPSGMRLLGIDPGLQRTGWGVLDVAGNRLTRVAAGVIKTDQSASTAERLVTIFRALLAIIDDYAPDEAAVEETFVNMNAGSTLKLGLARGVAMLAPAERGLPVAEYSPNAVKKAVTGAGHADKVQIQTMVRHLLPERDANAGPIGADAADALAIAICHAHHAASRRIIAAGRSAVSA